MAPESVSQMQVLDLRRSGERLLVVRHIVSSLNQTFLVKWYPLPTAPEGFQSVAGGVLYVPTGLGITVERDVAIETLHDGHYYKDPETDMLALLLPEGEKLVSSIPRPEAAKVFQRRLAVYWLASAVQWSLARSEADPEWLAKGISTARRYVAPAFSVDDYERYDVAISYASEDRAYAEEIAGLLKDAGKHVFFDHDEEAKLWGKDLVTELHAIYGGRAQYCLILLSDHYVRKMWTNEERKAALKKAVERMGLQYILPVRLDDTAEMEGMPATVNTVPISDGAVRICSLVLQVLDHAGAAAASGRDLPRGRA